MPTLQFKGKPLVQNHHLVVPFSELEPMKSRGVSKTPNLQDNLIIDPPYNTGNEGWLYNDRVNSPMMRDWLGRTVASPCRDRWGAAP